MKNTEIRRMKFGKGHIIYRQGETADALYIIKTGKIGLFLNSPRGSTEIVRLGPGQIVGDLSFFTGAQRTSDAITLAETECLRVSYDAVRSQFEAIPPWIQAMTRTLAVQVQSFSTEIKPLRDHEDSAGGAMSRLVVARAWAALTLVPHQFGQRKGEQITIDWPTLRSYANLCFREISERVMQLAEAMQTLGLCTVGNDDAGQLAVTLLKPKVFSEFLPYYTRAIVKNSPELSMVRPVEFATLTMLANPRLEVTPIHRGQVEIDLGYFKTAAERLGYKEVTATSVDLLSAYGVDIVKIGTETGVKLRFHQEDVAFRAQFWRILRVLQEMKPPEKAKAIAS